MATHDKSKLINYEKYLNDNMSDGDSDSEDEEDMLPDSQDKSHHSKTPNNKKEAKERIAKDMDVSSE